MTLGRKDYNLLEQASLTLGMYAGVRLDFVSAKRVRKLERMGLVTCQQPHNPIHKERVVITDKGKAVIA